jgi:hypothetical protein
MDVEPLVHNLTPMIVAPNAVLKTLCEDRLLNNLWLSSGYDQADAG